MTAKRTQFWLRQSINAALVGLTFTAGQAFANYDQLLKTLRENGHLTDEQLQSLSKSGQVRLSNSAVKDLQIRGRIQTQFAHVEAKNDDVSDNFSTFELRRARIGLRGTLFDSVRAQIEANLVPGSNLTMRSAFLQWREHKQAYVKVGYDKPHSSIEENTSSGEIITVERSMINSLVAAPGPMNGLAVDGDFGIFNYGVGAYTDTDNRNASGEVPRYLANAKLGLNLDQLVGDANKLALQVVYLQSDDTAGKVGGRFDQIMTYGAHFVSGALDVRAEYMQGDRDDNGIKGWYLMPSYYINQQFQAVLRFESAESDADRGISAASRYTRNVRKLQSRDVVNDTGDTVTVNSLAGNEYQAIYLGVNYYLTGQHAHKLMAGVEFASLDGTDAGKLESTSIYTAWRMLF